MRNNNNYSTPIAEIVCFESADVITSSGILPTSLSGLDIGDGGNEFDY